VDCLTHEIHKIKCPTNINDFTEILIGQGNTGAKVVMMVPFFKFEDIDFFSNLSLIKLIYLRSIVKQVIPTFINHS